MLNQDDIIYLDNNATTRVAPEVVAAMQPWLNSWWGNPSSGYRFGKQAAAAIEAARAQVAALLNCQPEEIIFTSGATESNNAALQSAIETTGKRHIVTTAVEHPSVFNYVRWLEEKGCTVTFLPVNADGPLDPHSVETAINKETALVSVMWANNETGVILPVPDIAEICAAKQVLFHTDAVQMAGKLPIDLKTTHPNFLSLSMHKLHAPRGAGVLFLRRHTQSRHSFSVVIRKTEGGQELKTWRPSLLPARRRNWHNNGPMRKTIAYANCVINGKILFLPIFRAPPSTAIVNNACPTPPTYPLKASRPPGYWS